MEYRIDSSAENKLAMDDMGPSFFLIGLLNEFINRFQSVGDSFFKEISWKQCFVLICIRLFEKPPTLGELSDLMGSSHQNVKQLLLKLEKAGYVEFTADQTDRRKQRIVTTAKTEAFSREHDASSDERMRELFQTVDAKELEITIQTIMKLDEELKRLQQMMK